MTTPSCGPLMKTSNPKTLTIIFTPPKNSGFHFPSILQIPLIPFLLDPEGTQAMVGSSSKPNSAQDSNKGIVLTRRSPVIMLMESMTFENHHQIGNR
ncbi:hypothetical protein AMTR_s00108p00068510 [Amborella trichopoda]|uniref:Uncharacterized protein n=1 Tax=Amborella trichopoda TaxID=13333 RepID=W1NVG9_AMBTC|nr:hypothetical protein AMTR_s00108p00068510 [Amborella trichopoda]